MLRRGVILVKKNVAKALKKDKILCKKAGYIAVITIALNRQPCHAILMEV
jgi:hypothetical protein